MGKIQVLDSDTINQIAAGEVVERPSAVVKELVENAIDAGANAVTVEIKGGGISLIRITDNGRGIAQEDVAAAFLRHATSKIRSAADLIHVASLGFRGEALSSIAAVAQVELLTRTEDDFTGCRYLIEGGVGGEPEPVGCPQGSTFLIRNLFFNTPARKKFLKAPATEAGYIYDTMVRMAVSHPEVSVKLMSDGQVKLQTPGNGNQKDVIYYLYGRDIAANLAPVAEHYPGRGVEGFVGKPSITRGNRNYENYFINGRFVRNSVISRAIEDAFKPYLMQHRYPFTSLMITVEPENIDVNVHPTKLEVRFRNSEAIYQLVYHAVGEALRSQELIPGVRPGKEEKVAERKPQPLPEPFEENRRSQLKRSLKPLFVQESLFGAGQAAEPGNTKTGDAGMGGILMEDASYLAGTRDPSCVGQSLQREDPSHVGQSLQREDPSHVGQSLQREDPSHGGQFLQREDPSHGGQSLQREDPSHAGQSLQREDPSHVGQSLQREASPQAGSPAYPGAVRLPGTVARPQEIPDVQRREVEGIIRETARMPAARSPHFLSPEAAPERRVIGQLFGTYWLVEFKDTLYLMDQHAAHEKVLFERTMARIRSQDTISQNLLPPLIITLTPREEEALAALSDTLAQAGFEIEPFGGREFAVAAVPADLYETAGDELLTSILDDYMEGGSAGTPEAVLERVATMSCKAAVKGNSTLSMAEAEALIGELMALDNPYHCPHGRPTMISMSKQEIEKKFKRIV